VAVLLRAVLLLVCVSAGSLGQGFFSSVQAARSEIWLEFVSEDSGTSMVEVAGLNPADLVVLDHASLSNTEWQQVFRVFIADDIDSDRLPVLGKYSITNLTIRFTPLYPFDLGQDYDVVFNPAGFVYRKGLSVEWPTDTLVKRFHVKTSVTVPSTAILGVFPSAKELPENQLRFYVFFSAPMGFKGGSAHVSLLDSDGSVIPNAFLPLDVALWNNERTRYTMLFDPGRVKTGIFPNQQDGRPLQSGENYTLVIDRHWADSNGIPLVESYKRSFQVVPPEKRPIVPSAWNLEVPRAGSVDSLKVSFLRSLDYALLHRALVVINSHGEAVQGEMFVQKNETEWYFTPVTPWSYSEYRLLILPVLEDPSGNRVNRSFEVESTQSIIDKHESSSHLAFRPRLTQEP
tara:strand:- start:29756 stop:30961 length:1206 start_codon:yes stop_codon:yes gene_type:complete